MSRGRESLLGRLTGRERRGEREIQRIEAKRRSLMEATQQWLSLLREMERDGQTADARYEAYYQAYLEAKQAQKRADLELFNLRQGLAG